LSVTGSVTYLAASSFSDNSWIEENTRRGSLKPHTTAESFGGLVNFSISRKDYNVPAVRETFQFSDEECLRYIFLTEPLFLIPSVQTDVQESGPTRGAILFSKEPLFLMPPGRARSPRAAREIGFRKGPPDSFRGNHFSSFLPAEIGCPAAPVARRESLHMFLREPLSLIPLGFTDAPLAPDSLQQFFSSPSLQGGSGIPAVPKTGASVLRLLPPTS